MFCTTIWKIIIVVSDTYKMLLFFAIKKTKDADIQAPGQRPIDKPLCGSGYLLTTHVQMPIFTFI